MEYLIAFAISLIAGLVAIIVYERKNALNVEYRLDAQSLSIMKLALSLLCEEDREFYEDEWFMFLFDQPTSSKRLIQACSFMVAAGRIAGREKVAAVAGARSFGSLSFPRTSVRAVLSPVVDAIERLTFFVLRQRFRLRETSHTHLVGFCLTLLATAMLLGIYILIGIGSGNPGLLLSLLIALLGVPITLFYIGSLSLSFFLTASLSIVSIVIGLLISRDHALIQQIFLGLLG